MRFTWLIIQICKDPRWGRSYECYSEDTEIVRKMTSIISGLQGQLPQGHEHGYPFVAGRSAKSIHSYKC
jgi:beta-glucosidase